MILYRISVINEIKGYLLVIFYSAVILSLLNSCINPCLGQESEDRAQSPHVERSSQAGQLQADDSEERARSPHSQNQRGSGNSRDANYDLKVSVEPKNPLRNTFITLNISFKNNDTDSFKVGYIKCNLDPRFRANQIKGNKNKEININAARNIKITPDGNVKMNEFKNYSCLVFVPLDLKANEKYSIISNIEVVIPGYDASKNINTSEYSIYVQNNPPNIQSAEAYLTSNQLKEMNGNLFFLGNDSDQIELELNISSNDTESNDISFGCQMIIESENLTCNLTNDINCINNFNLSFDDLKYNRRYSFLSLARDNDKGISNKSVDLIFNGNTYHEIWTPDIPKSQLIALIISIILTFIITGIILNRFGLYRGKIFSLKKLFSSLVVIWGVYCFIFNLEPRMLLGSGFIFFNSLIFFELAVYLSVFLIISYFIEACFSHDASIPITSLISNSLIMIIFLLILMWLFPRSIDLTRDLSIYYSTLAGVYGTVFALIVTLSGQIPKNIFTIPRYLNEPPGIKCPPGALLPPGESLLYLKKLKYFVALYGISLGLSLLGLILGEKIRYDTLITGSLQEIALLLMPIVLFETTFLLIPPTIISMYHLMQVASFRGKVIIKSKPRGAVVCLSRCRFPQKSSSIEYLDRVLAKLFPILRPESNQDKKVMYDLGLTTPCTLMLTKGEYRICLRTKDHKLDKPATITSRDGIEIEYKFDLIRIPAPIKSDQENNISASGKESKQK